MACQCGAADCANCSSPEEPALMVCCCCDEELDLADVRRGNGIVDGDGVAWCWYCFNDKCGKPEVGGRCEGKGEREI